MLMFIETKYYFLFFLSDLFVLLIGKFKDVYKSEKDNMK